MKWWRRRLIICLAAALGLSGATSATPGDPSSTSTNFRLQESELGGTGNFNSGSTNFFFTPGTDDGGATLGDTFVGNSSSANFQTNAGFNTTAQPGLTLTVNTAAIDFGVVTTGTAATATATFDVIDYTSYGYVVSIIGNPPTMNGRQITALTTDTASNASVEQFGLNAVKNTSPTNPLGDDPLQVPDNVYSGSIFSYGRAGTGAGTAYAQANKFRYNSNDASPVASSAKSSGDTKYTLSFIMNVTSTTPGGKYTGGLQIVATGTY